MRAALTLRAGCKSAWGGHEVCSSACSSSRSCSRSNRRKRRNRNSLTGTCCWLHSCVCMRVLQEPRTQEAKTCPLIEFVIWNPGVLRSTGKVRLTCREAGHVLINDIQLVVGLLVCQELTWFFVLHPVTSLSRSKYFWQMLKRMRRTFQKMH